MKKLIFVLALAIMIFTMASCDNSVGGAPDTNGNETKGDVITLEDGYLVVNGVKTEYKVHSEPKITIIDGYVAVNGVKTEYKVSECEHIWNTVTTAPTCSSGGYDTMTCSLCKKSVQTNETEKAEHTYGKNYVIDNEYHWFKCTECESTKNKEMHTLDDDGACTTCLLPVSATPGVIYDISSDGSYAEVVGYEGTATKVKIAEEYKGLPVKNIYDSSFSNNQTIISVVIPDSVTSIGGFAFCKCYSLTSVVIGDSVERIGDNAFDSCSLESVVIGDSVECIGDNAFTGCTSLESIVIPDSVTSIGRNAFSYCLQLEFNEYGNCKYLGSKNNPYLALIEPTNKNLRSYEIHSDTNVLAASVFSDCSRLTTIKIPDGVTSIGYNTFWYCTSLASIEIPDSVTSIGSGSFVGCSSLTDVYYTGTEEEWAEIVIDESYYEQLTYATIHYNYTSEE